MPCGRLTAFSRAPTVLSRGLYKSSESTERMSGAELRADNEPKEELLLMMQ